MRITLRPAVEEDALFVDELTRKCMTKYVQQTWPEKADWDAYFQKNKFAKNPTRIIECNGIPAGRVSVLDQDGIHWIDNIHVLPEFQSKGIGSEVIRRVLEESRNSNVSLVRLMLLKVNPVKTLYERLGFRVYEETKTHFFMEYRY